MCVWVCGCVCIIVLYIMIHYELYNSNVNDDVT